MAWDSDAPGPTVTITATHHMPRLASPPATSHRHSLPLQQQHNNQLASQPDNRPRRPRHLTDKRQPSSERILSSSSNFEPLTDAATAMMLSPRRQSVELGNPAMMASGGAAYVRPRAASSITFADVLGTRSADEDSARIPYRDRKLSESVVSLTGVMEEEESTPSPVTPLLGDGEAGIQPVTTSNRASPPMVRSSSQRRISQEINMHIGMGSPRLVAAMSTGMRIGESSDPSNHSPARQAPVRRNSARAAALPHARHNPTRSLSVGGPVSAAEESGNAEPCLDDDLPAMLQRVPFPRSMSTSNAVSSESPSAKRIGRHLSLSGVQSSESVHIVPTSPRLNAARLANIQSRHMRYSSDLHVVRPNFTTSRSEASFEDRSRSRRSSEVGSLYANTLDDSASLSGVKLGRDPSVKPSKHRLVLTEENKPDVTLQLGNCIGRGQFGSVYRALNLNTGQMVAVKRIKLNGRSEDEVTQLMREVELLKSLVHPSVVKYEGLARGDDVVSIVLEYVENGSLLHTLKAFGNFPEKLVASYVVKILEGLNYLHEMKVVHCDLKAANILTTKNGNVKLSDFGVSLNLKAAEDLKKNDAIGTPNWMAPEVIELKGASTAADIWSLGCTIIELLTGKPPYGDMLAMSAMWRIVEDDCPPLPTNISDKLLDFLTQCFHKDASLRPSAAVLFEHAWLRNTWTDHKALRPQDSVPFFKRLASTETRKGSMRRTESERKGTTGRSRQLTVTQADVSKTGIDRPGDADSSSSGQMERSTSSPNESVALRPHLVSMRASSAPDAWGVMPIKEVMPEREQEPRASTPLYSPAGASTNLSVSPPAMVHSDAMGRRGSDVTSTSTSLDLLRSPHAFPGVDKERNGGEAGPMSPSFLDLTSPTADVFMMDEQANKTHAFVKSSFSKAVQCKICREAVKKNAVLCEECGLICHASCARKAATPCSLRAQLLMLASNQRSSVDMVRVMSPTPSVSTPPPPTPVAASSPVFRFPFGKYKRNSKGASDLNLPATLSSSPQTIGNETEQKLPKSPPLTPLSPNIPVPADGNKRQKRTRRISLLPSHLSRHRSPSPSPTPPIMVKPAPEVGNMVRSLSSTQSIHDDSLGYGSSASSMSSSFQLGSPTSQVSSTGRSQFPSIEIRNHLPMRSDSASSTQPLHIQLQAPPRGGIPRRQRHMSASAAPLSVGSTPNLIASAAYKSDTRPIPPNRQASRGAPWSRAQFGSSGRPESQEGDLVTSDVVTAAAVPQVNAAERRHNRRLSSKQDCIIA